MGQTVKAQSEQDVLGDVNTTLLAQAEATDAEAADMETALQQLRLNATALRSAASKVAALKGESSVPIQTTSSTTTTAGMPLPAPLAQAVGVSAGG